MEIKIGVQHSPREVSLDSELSPEDVQAAVSKAIDSGSVLTLTDDRGRTVVVPGTKIAYVEIGAPAGRRVGFGS